MTERPGFFRALVERASDLAMLVDAEGRLLYVSPAVAHIFGYTPAEIEQLIGFDFIHPDDVAARAAAWEQLVTSPPGTVEISRFRARHRDGSWRHVEQRATNLLADPEVRGLAISLRDVTAAVAADEALSASHTQLQRVTAAQERLIARYRTAVEAADLGVWEYDRSSRELNWDADPELGAHASTGGLAPGRHHIRELVELMHADDVGPWLRTVRSALDRRTSFSAEFRVQLPSGLRRWELFGRSVQLEEGERVVGTVRDVTELRRGEELLRRHEEQLARAERFSAMGEVAAGLAHDVSNLMVVVGGRADLLAMRLGEDDEDVRELAETARRGRELLQRVMSFAQRQPGQGEVADAVATVRAFAASASHLLGPGVVMDLVVDAGCPHVAIPAADLDQVLLNLTTNARRAVPDGGHVRISLTRTSGPDGDEASHPWAELLVEDDGVGIDADLLPQVFDPFVTTATRHGGTGLGLAIVYRVVTNAGGEVGIESTPGVGTTVRVLLPGVTDAR